MKAIYQSGFQYLSLYGNKRERQLANKILSFHFKRLVLSRKVDAESYKTIIKQGLPMTYTTNRKEAKQLMSEIRRDIKNRNSVSHFIKGLNVAQKDIAEFLMGSLVFATFMVLFATITLLLVPVVPLN